MPFRFTLKNILTGIVTLLITTTTLAATYPRCDAIPAGLSRMLRNVSSSVRVGVVVQSMNTGQIVFSHNAHELFAPASVQKIFTVSAALIRLTPNYRFPTRILTTGPVTNGVLHGNLIFQFNGDPSLKESDVVQLVKTIRAQGIHTIDGNVMIDNTAFNHIPYPAGWLWSDLSSDFAAPLDTVVINRNKFGMTFVPAPRNGERPILIPRLPPGSATFINEARTTSHPVRNCPFEIQSNQKNEYIITGCLSRSLGKQYRTLAIRNMEMFTHGLIRELLRQHDIRFNGQIITQKTPANSTLFTEHFSLPLKQLIVHLLKKSDNLYADTLLKKMGEHYHKQPGSWENGLQAEAPIFADVIGLNLNHLRLVDGAGLSQYNMVTPSNVAQVLRYIHRNDMLRDTLVPALPIAGVDGTLAWRMPTLARGKRVHAKTGSMTGVSTLAGFVKTNHHGLLSFVIMANNVPKYRAPYIALENRMVEFLATAGYC